MTETIKLVTIKLPNNPNHNPRAKVTGPCVISPECTDSTGEHHTVAVHTNEQVAGLRDHFGHITRVETVELVGDASKTRVDSALQYLEQVILEGEAVLDIAGPSIARGVFSSRLGMATLLKEILEGETNGS